MISYLPLNTDVIYDACGNVWNYNNVIFQTIDGRNCYKFISPDSYIQCNKDLLDLDMEDWCLCLWYKQETNSSTPLFGGRENWNYNSLLQVSVSDFGISMAMQFNGDIWGPWSINRIIYPIADCLYYPLEWTHYVFTRYNNSLKIFINGVLTHIEPNLERMLPLNRLFRLGSDDNYISSGYYSEFKIYNFAKFNKNFDIYHIGESYVLYSN